MVYNESFVHLSDENVNWAAIKKKSQRFLMSSILNSSIVLSIEGLFPLLCPVEGSYFKLENASAFVQTGGKYCD